jgi:hypothetical protein
MLLSRMLLLLLLPRAARLSVDVGLRLQLEQETNKWFPASNSGREVRQ